MNYFQARNCRHATTPAVETRTNYITFNGLACLQRATPNRKTDWHPSRLKIEVRQEDGLWHDVRSADAKPLTFKPKKEARAKLVEMVPVLVKMAQHAGGKRTRVIAILEDEDD
ncbi:MAG: hypothetical protein HY525_07100 [Betaproteobacteria bacterium]|nr:hypothetical protein [Betaproteobacteria bacterium]